MRLTLKYASKSPSGNWQYRRRVPKAVAGVIIKREFKAILGETEKQAQAAYPRVHAEFEREIAAAKRKLAGGTVPTTQREAYEAALVEYREIEALDPSRADFDIAAENILSAYPTVDGQPVGVPETQRHLANLLFNGPGDYGPPPASLEDALSLYLAEKGHDPEGKDAIRIRRDIGRIAEALGRDPAIWDLTREDARKVRDFMLGRHKNTGERVSPASVARELNTIKAVVNFAAREFSGVPAGFVNPFNSLPLPTAAGMKVSDKRHPLPPKVLAAIRQRILGPGISPNLKLLWRLLEGTGCRLAEVSGLRVSDVVLTGDLGGPFPHIRIVGHPLRSLKTTASIRNVPLIGDALEAAKEALALPRDGEMLLPDYGRKGGPTAASAALMKHVRAISTDPKHTVHSLRHGMKDWLGLAHVSAQVQNLILGHDAGGVGDAIYGGEPAKLERATEALSRALERAARGGQE